MPYVTLDVFSKSNSFLTPNQVILTAKQFEVRGTVNMHEYVSVLTVLAAADWASKAKTLFRMFDFDQSQGLDRDETAILIMSVYCGLAKATNQAPPAPKAVSALVISIFAQIRSLREVTLDLILDFLPGSELFVLMSSFKATDTRKIQTSFLRFHGTPRTTSATPASSHVLPFSRKSSRLSRLDYSPSVNKSLQQSSGFSNSSRIMERDGFSLPPALRRTKGLIIVSDTQDGEQVTSATIHDMLSVYLSLQSSISSQPILFPRLTKRINDRLRRELEARIPGDFPSFLRLAFPRATNTQMSILLKWGSKKKKKGKKMGAPLSSRLREDVAVGQSLLSARSVRRSCRR